MWVRTTLTIKRWTEEKPGCKTDIWDKSESTGKGAGQKAGGAAGRGSVRSPALARSNRSRAKAQLQSIRLQSAAGLARCPRGARLRQTPSTPPRPIAHPGAGDGRSVPLTLSAGRSLRIPQVTSQSLLRWGLSLGDTSQEKTQCPLHPSLTLFPRFSSLHTVSFWLLCAHPLGLTGGEGLRRTRRILYK